MADDVERGSLLDRKQNDTSPPPYSAIQTMSSPASNRNGPSQRYATSSPATATAVVCAPLLDDRVVSAVIHSVPPLERAFSVPDRHDSYVNVAVKIDDPGRTGHGSLKTTRRSDSARSNRTRNRPAIIATETCVDQTDSLVAGTATTTRRRGKDQHGFSSLHRSDSGNSVNLSRKSYERLTGIELPPSRTPSSTDMPVTVDPPVIITVATPSTATSPRPPGSAARNCIRLPGDRPSPLPTIKMDENNVPQIDVAITPTSEYFDRGGQTSVFTLGAPPPPRHRRSGSPSCRLRRPLSGRHASDALGTSSASATAGVQVPMLTVTRDVDDDSLISDYITPSPFSFAGRDVDRLASPFANVGDDISLYGTPKEEMSPFREGEVSTPIRASPTNFLRDQIVAFFQPSDNKLAMKLFGNKNALMKEKQRQRAAGNWVIHPCSNFRSVTL